MSNIWLPVLHVACFQDCTMLRSMDLRHSLIWSQDKAVLIVCLVPPSNTNIDLLEFMLTTRQPWYLSIRLETHHFIHRGLSVILVMVQMIYNLNWEMSFQNEKIGMMDDGYFVSRGEILKWINDLLQVCPHLLSLTSWRSNSSAQGPSIARSSMWSTPAK